ncbi:CAP domain-containing protein [Streptomyces sp. URMC 129]|uniref:CAP domain-containing protein n=1 Tax=Streptomyces sp. URMC 129 TaxID=3423407 RepID=UPI003F1DD727
MGRHRRHGGHARTGLIGASAALAVGAVAVSTGLLPGLGDGLTLSGPDERTAVERSAASAGASSSPSSPRAEERGSAPEPTGQTSGPAEEETSSAGTPAPSREQPSPREREPEPEAGSRTAPEPEPEAAEQEPEPEEERDAEAAPEPDRADPPAEEAPEPAPAPAPAPVTDPELAAAQAVLALVNEERAAVGCRPLTTDPELTELAAGRSADMAARDYFAHTDPDGLTPWDHAAAAGVTSLGAENIAWGQPNPEAVMDAWMESEGHRANILNCAFTTVGIGVHIQADGPWWTQEFGF